MTSDEAYEWDTRPGGADSDMATADEGVGIVMTTSGAMFLPVSLQRASEEQRAVVAELQRVVLAYKRAGLQIAELVSEARDVGASWDLIGWSVGTTGRAASMRFGPRRD